MSVTRNPLKWRYCLCGCSELVMELNKIAFHTERLDKFTVNLYLGNIHDTKRKIISTVSGYSSAQAIVQRILRRAFSEILYEKRREERLSLIRSVYETP